MRDQGSIPAAPLPSSPHGTSSFLSQRASGTAQQGDTDGKAGIETQPPCARSQEHHWDKTLHCMGLAFPASLRPSCPQDVVAGKPKQTSLKPLPHDKDRPKLCLNTSDCEEATPTLLKKKQNPGQKRQSHQLKCPTWCYWDDWALWNHQEPPGSSAAAPGDSFPSRVVHVHL